MYTLFFKARNNNNIYFKIIYAILVIGIALVISFGPIAQTVGYAAIAEEVAPVISTIVSAVAGYLATDAIFVATGLAAASIPLTIYGFLFILCAAGIGCCVSQIVKCFTSPSFMEFMGKDSFISLSKFDLAKSALVLSGTEFSKLITKVKQWFGVMPEFPTTFDELPVHEVSSETEALAYYSKDNYKVERVNSDDDYYDYVVGPDTILHFPYNNGPFAQKCFPDRITFGDDLIIEEDPNEEAKFIIKFKNSSFCMRRLYALAIPSAVLTPLVCHDEEKLYFSSVSLNSLWGGLFCSFYDQNLMFSFDDCTNWYRAYDDSSNGLYISYSGKNHYLYCGMPDGSLIRPTNYDNLMYLLFYKNATLLHTATNIDYAKDVSEINPGHLDNISNAGNVIGSIKSGSSVSDIGYYNKNSTYKKSKDQTNDIINTGVKPNSVALQGTTINTGDITDTTEIADCIDVSDVVTSDKATTDVIEELPMPVENYWIDGIELIKAAGMSIADKFPFCLPKYLYNQLNILVSDEKEPIFHIPFHIESANLNYDVEIDLTRFDSLLKITDFFLVAILIVGLIFATKKIQF